MKKPVAVIILNWNGAELLRKYLPSVIKYTNREIADVIVADNGSTDSSLKVLAEEFPQVKVITFADNLGFAEGYNQAINATMYSYTVLLNSDVRASEHWLEPMLDYCESHPEVGACQPKLLCDYGDSQNFEYAGAAGGFIDCHGYPYCRGRLFGTVERDNGQYDGEPKEIFWATGACLMVRSELYCKVGGLDKDFFAHMEEIDLCWRIHLAGFCIKCVTDSRMYHFGGGSLPASNPKKTYLNFRNNLLLLHKNLPVRDGKRLLFVRRLYDTLSFFMFCAKMSWGDARAVLRAHGDFRKMRGNYKNQPEKNLLKSFPGTERNIVIDYYLRGKRK